MSFVETAINAAVFGHRDQVDKGGKPYVYHPLTVGLNLEKDGYIDEVVAAGFLHDVIEDTSITLRHLEIWDSGALSIPEATIVAVDHLTRREGETYKEYKVRCFQNPIAKLIKFYDSKHNLTRTEGVLDEDFLKFIQYRYGGTVTEITVELEKNPKMFDSLKRR